MHLNGIVKFYERVTPERLEEYLKAHGWIARCRPGDIRRGAKGDLLGQWWTLDAAALVVATRAAGDRVARNADAASTLAAVEKRWPTAVLYDLLPSGTDREFVLECFPQLEARDG